MPHRQVAALSLAAAVVVIVVTPMILEWPNPLSTPAAVVVAIGCGGALTGGRGGERVAMAISAAGLVLSALWLWLASDGFGKGTPWWDDIAEAAILVMAFLVAIVALLLAGRRRSPG
jgi:ABC-type Na+ efflux pump permease subunit